MKCPRLPIEEDVLIKIKPSNEERRHANKALKAMVGVIERILKSIVGNKVDYEVRVDGSFAKDTWLSGDMDFDLFILFEKDKCIEYAENEGFIKAVGARIRNLGLRVELRYAQHPYLRVNYSGYWFEVVPGCKIEVGERPLTPVDRTPLHTKYINSKLTAEQKDEVRLLKSFLKGIGVYGAEIAVEGFSGYLAELLIVKYKCFRELLHAATTWKPPVVIDIESHYDDYKAIIEFFGKDKPMIVVDPIDPKRNVAAAVSLKSLSRFILASSLYIRNPDKRFYHISRIRGRYKHSNLGNIIAVAGDRIGNLVIIVIEPKSPEPPDKMWGVGKRITRILVKNLKLLGFNIVNYNTTACSEKRILICLEALERTIPRLEVLEGPPVWLRNHALRFYEKYITDHGVYGPWIGDNGRLYVLRPRRYIDMLDAIKERIGMWLPRSASNYEVKLITTLPLIDSLTFHQCEIDWLEECIMLVERWERKTWIV